jgi:hypothetical protein
MMADLITSQDVINVSGVLTLPEYEGLVPFQDPKCPGFSVRRNYPPDTELSKVLTRQGNPDLCCLIKWGIPRAQVSGGVRGMHFSASVFSRWNYNRFPDDYDFSNPDCPTPESVHSFKRGPKPKDLTFDDEFFYDTADGQFYGQDGRPVTGKQILDYLYDYHCRTLRRSFRIKSAALDICTWSIRWVLRRLQDIAAWLLEHGYDIKLTERDHWYFFRTYGFSDFKRISPDSNSHFFGFQSSKRSLFSNMLLLAVICLLAYRYLPRGGFFEAVYRNAPMTTAALVFMFLLLDQVIPLFLKGVVCGISRLRPATLFMIRKVRA